MFYSSPRGFCLWAVLGWLAGCLWFASERQGRFGDWRGLGGLGAWKAVWWAVVACSGVVVGWKARGWAMPSDVR